MKAKQSNFIQNTIYHPKTTGVIVIDKDGNISSWAIGHKDSKVKSFLQNMSEKAEEILQKQLEKAKDTKEGKEVFSMKKHKEVIKKNKVDLKV